MSCKFISFHTTYKSILIHLLVLIHVLICITTRLNPATPRGIPVYEILVYYVYINIRGIYIYSQDGGCFLGCTTNLY